VAAKPFADLDAKWAPTETRSTNFHPRGLSLARRQTEAKPHS